MLHLSHNNYCLLGTTSANPANIKRNNPIADAL